MNALPRISHQLLVASLGDPSRARSARAKATGEVVIDCESKLSARPSGIQSSGAAQTAGDVYQRTVPAMGQNLWPF